MNSRLSHLDQIERWAHFVRENPTRWKKIHTDFINAIFQKNEDVIKKILEMPNGREKIIELYNIKNTKGYSWLK